MEALRQTTHLGSSVVGQGSEKMKSMVQSWLGRTFDMLRVYVNRYPPLAAFIFALFSLSSIPVGIFLIFATISSSITLFIALSGFALVEGVMLLMGGGVLLLVLGGIGFFTTVGFTWISGLYLAYRGTSYLYSTVTEHMPNVGSVSEMGTKLAQAIPIEIGRSATQQSGVGSTAGY